MSKNGGNTYNKMIITPLMMDYGYKELEAYKDIHYSIPPRKPIREQVDDLFTGIKIYTKNEYKVENDDDDE